MKRLKRYIGYIVAFVVGLIIGSITLLYLMFEISGGMTEYIQRREEMMKYVKAKKDSTQTLNDGYDNSYSFPPSE